MLFLNSIKLLFSNFSLVYKILIYKLIAFVVSLSVVSTFAFNCIKTLNTMGAFSSFSNIFKAGSVKEFLTLVSDFFSHFYNVLRAANSETIAIFVVSLLVFIVLFMFLYNLDKIAQAEYLSAKLSANCKLSYTGLIFKRLGYSCLFSLINLLYLLIIYAIMLIIFVSMLSLLTASSFISTIAPFLICAATMLMWALSLTFVSAHNISCVINETGIISGAFKNIKIIFKNFLKVFSYNICFILTALFINLFASMISAGALLILTLPMSIVFCLILNTVCFYEGNGSRYYLDAETIITPKKQEYYDKVKDINNII